MPALLTTQMYTASSIHLFSLAFHEPAASAAGEASRRHLQLLRGQLLHQIRRDDGHLPRWRRVSPPFLVSSAVILRTVGVTALRRISLFRRNKSPKSRRNGTERRPCRTGPVLPPPDGPFPDLTQLFDTKTNALSSLPRQQCF